MDSLKSHMQRVGQNHSTVGENVVFWEADGLRCFSQSCLHTQLITLLICAHIVSSLVIMGRLDESCCRFSLLRERKLTSQA